VIERDMFFGKLIEISGNIKIWISVAMSIVDEVKLNTSIGKRV
jgi:hypothetical protein